MSNVLIGIASEFDAKGFKQADSSLNVLTKRVAKFTAGLGLAYKAQRAVLNAMADEKATKLLAQNLKNVGLAFAQVPAENFIKQMQRQTGILDDELRPAYAQLARITGSVTKTQELLNSAFNISAGTGKDFGQVVDALSKAYVGNNKGLRSLNIGLTQAELSSKSFDEVLTLLNKQFAGAGAASLDTYAGKMQLLQVATANASETIGFALLDALQKASGANGFEDFINKINSTADAIARLIQFAGRGVEVITLTATTLFDEKGRKDKVSALVERIQKEERERGLRKILSGLGTSIGPRVQTAAEKAAELAAKKRAAEILAANKKITAEKKKQTELEKAMTKGNALLNQANALFDLERVGVAAAMQNQTLTDNERKRLEIKQAIFSLEDALDSKDTKRIENASKLLGGLMSQFATLQAQDTLLGQIKTSLDALGQNKDLINLANLDAALAKILAMIQLLKSLTSSLGGTPAKKSETQILIDKIASSTTKAEMNTAVNAATAGGASAGAIANALTTALINTGTPTPTALSIARYTGQAIDWWNKQNMAINAATNPSATTPAAPTVSVTVTDNANKLVDVIMNTVTEQSASGNLPYIVRNGRQLAW